MTENFAELFAESVKDVNFQSGTVRQAEIIDITSSFVVVYADGSKSESYIPIAEFRNQNNKLEIIIGDIVDVVLESFEDGTGKTIFSRDKAKRLEVWRILEQAFESGETVKGIVTERVRGGFTVEIDRIRAFLPGSLVDIKPIRDTSYIEGKELEFKIIKVDKKQNNIVVSRRAALMADDTPERKALLESLRDDAEVIGIIKNLTDYGAFVDLGGIDGLLHITDISWKRIRHPNELLRIGDEIKVKILKYDRDKNRVSLGLKQLTEDPWCDISRRYPVGTRIFGKVTNITDYGCFVEIEDGIEGLVHISEINWTNKNIHPSKVVVLGQKVEVVVLEINEERRRTSLGMKQCKSNPWKEYCALHKKGEKIKGIIKSITDFGIFIGLDGDIDGLVHLSDITWNEAGEKAIRNYRKGQEIEAIVLAIDADRERISLGIKQLEHDIYAEYLELHPKGSIVKGIITDVVTKSATVNLGDNIVGKIKAIDVSRENVKDATELLKVGDNIEAKVIEIDKKSRIINLSIREAQLEFGDSDTPQTNTQLGDLLKKQMQQSSE
ncbi:MAG: 30S ribosomal protein S1 [Coxiellaceae bacterium]|jgi:small subunit ribosomal protein S1|nr:30S ribosomal protein S1 [Coxiellaceae bacterium]